MPDATWIILSLLSAVFVSARHLYVKRYCAAIPSSQLVFITRLAGTVVVWLTALRSEFVIHDLPVFATVTTVTVLLTAVATVSQITIIQRAPVSRSVPYLNFIPLFMLPWTALLLNQSPSLISLLGILCTCAGAWALNARRGMRWHQPLKLLAQDRNAWIMGGVAVLLGLTTTCDKIAIAAANAVTYVQVWTVASTVVMGTWLVVRRTELRLLLSRTGAHAGLQSILWAAGFLLQMLALQHVEVSAGVAYVKTLTMVNVLLTVWLGGRLFREAHQWRNVLATSIMVAGAMAVILGR
jgi:drug/metabolite transporter (DMT)-like permease